MRTTRSRNRSTTRKYQRYTCSQLSSLARKWQKQYNSVAKLPVWKKIKGKTPAQQCTIIVKELRAIVKVLRSKTLKVIDTRVKTLKTQIARRIGVAVKSGRATSTAIKRLIVKRRKIVGCKKLAAFVRLCSTLKISSYKNGRTTTYVGKKTKGRAKSYTTGTKSVTTTKYKNQTKTLKKEIQKLKQRNAFMKRQVAKFRKQVSQMQRHYGSLKTNKPWRVVKSKKVTQDVSNIVRFSNALSNAFLGKQQRKAG